MKPYNNIIYFKQINLAYKMRIDHLITINLH
jgi:hypothetical protein